MQPLIYGELVDWYDLLDPPADHLDEAVAFHDALARSVSPAPRTLLELGAGAGHNALHLKRWFACTLSDLSPAMLARSRRLNPDCEHVPGDMRTLRLGRLFDAVLVHDAIAYMTSVDDLRAAALTAFQHTRPGGAAIFAPDCLRETFREHTELYTGEQGSRALRCLEWTWDPDPVDDTYSVEYAFLMRDGATVKAAHDRHTEGLFTRDTWTHVLENVGYLVEPLRRPLGDGEFDQVFLCRRPAGAATSRPGT
jgi:SAM-dependent methyltransferase